MESLRIYNTLARDKQVFVPRRSGEVRMYVCGITVYDYCHVGHARMLVVFDLVQRWLRAIGYRVTYVRNITDIDDKIIRRAVENGETIKSLTDRFIGAMHEDEDALGIQRPDIEPRATQFIPQMLGMIEQLESNGYAYQATDGDVNYSVRKFANYGKLSGKSLDDLRAGERVAANDAKEDPLDFVLWKRAKPEDPEGASWESKYGMGRPGWHIECSAMGCTLLGEHFDIHGGGQDLQFPHHENEIAQSEGATGQTFVNYWMHNGFVQVDNEKMSKSLGNFFTIREVLERYDAEVVRFFIVRTHYRSPLNYSDVHLDDARASLTRLYTALKDVEPDALALDWSEPHAQRFAAAMNDDFNTPVAIATLFELAGEVNRTRDASLARQLKQLAGLLGLLGREPRAFLQQASGAARDGGLAADEIEAKIAARVAAKQAKDYAEADRIRAELLDAGIALEDKPGGSTEWRRV
ncbi:cysteine--tRNA ligase [Burkholderia dolosa]|uniref:Cysteine--tRNA ligase n=1 Tax=Burkholderia dolosa TaxID=152500 RepID=A0A892I3Z2_9BURK|nr:MULTISPECIES: cysteine--tRNA ligase [Burkholderia]AKE03310.1 cysteinyl-tRNA synthetase [Burkholderia cepacia]AJY11782.1 cysteine--tRNA ligase [Burkholderia dolosa AU0158]AYZ98066.1 cysteine--tRNA ligase [Burkholderia dolosa]EAY68497.1 Cysteinyl-tRNA synthetase [Burkholderia dolosa AU0158]ETP65134.1 cysteinyl-tRNA synthetase [Burkholderia dolosa PC543]